MPVNTTVSHVSPLFSYIPRSAWSEPNSQDDPDLKNYAFGGYHATNNSQAGNASVTFSWWGTDIWVYGGYRTWLGNYQVILDETTSLHEGYVDGTEEVFDYVLFNATGLPEGQHQIRITNVSNDSKRPKLDIEHVVFASTLGFKEIMQHTDPECIWSPLGAWQVDTVSHTTNDSFGTMELEFTGKGLIECSGLLLYGIIDQATSPLSVTLDGKTSHALIPNTAMPAVFNASQVLFAATNLNEGNHTLRVENNPTNSTAPRQRMGISFAKVLSANGINTNGTVVPVSSPTANADGGKKSMVIALTVGALGISLLALFIWRAVVHTRRKTKRQYDVFAARPFLLSSHTRNSSYPSFTHPYPTPSSLMRSHRFQPSLGVGLNQSNGHNRRGTSILGEIDALRRSFSRMRPPPVTIPPRSQKWMEYDLASPEVHDLDSTGHRQATQPIASGSGLARGHVRERSVRPLSDATIRTSSSCTVWDSASVRGPTSPRDAYPLSPPAIPPGLGSPPPFNRNFVYGAIPATQPLRVGQRSSVDKPLRRQLVGSPVTSLPSSRATRSPMIPPPPLPPLPPQPLRDRTMYNYDEEPQHPPPYQSTLTLR